MVTWKELLKEAFNNNDECFDDMTTTLTDLELCREFSDGYGGTEGSEFTAWGEKYVYFPVCYDGSEWVGCAPRNLCEEKCYHQGGG